MPPTGESRANFFTDLIKFSLVALLIVVPIRLYIAQPFIVSGDSMVPTFHNGEYLIVDEVSYRFEEPARGDVIIFRYPKDPSKYFIKRIIGLPGDTVALANGTVTITNTENPDGFVEHEPYLMDAQRTTERYTVALGEGEYFVLGDNRPASSDSRSWGVLPEDNIVGRAFLRLLPIAHAAVLPGAPRAE